MNADTETIDKLFEILRNERRRRLCFVMADTDDQVFSLEELVDQLVPQETTVDTTEAEVHDCIAASIHHIHLPKMADFGIIEYDERSSTVRCEDLSMSEFGDWERGNLRVVE
ncbi:DUF7344 domain-containing protein [Haladaptatus sp. DFWS20]|uniref:DUF7344 domain-containing protein n=1 Tax=Haladaptatus sp. DFWS20 TaxID=3403467 RepID=UPI003EB9BBC5